ncbi:hypothetical protein B6U93_01685 [Candidatus Woesearchaeota archaeon ex4484_78]|nr:MAG: hypothetical protein B6U93_01685 [Candidatus Woesearchaeota archaeon ex4484_78]
MGFTDFCIKTRWWFLVIGILTFSFGIGWILLIFSIIGFVKNHSPANKKNKNYSLPAGFNYPDKVKKDNFIKCPVCKKGKIKKDKKKPKFKNCDFCKAQFKKTGEKSFKLSVKNCSDEYADYQYANCDFSLNEWNTIALTGKTLRENILEQFRRGDVPNLSEKEIKSPVALKSKEHFIWVEQSQLYEPRAVRNYKGGSVRVAKGAYIHLGQAESHQEMRHIDNGFLTLTNKRLIFSGGQRSSNIDLKRIINITVYSDGFKVNIENRQKPQFFATNDSEFWHALLTGAIKNNS